MKRSSLLVLMSALTFAVLLGAPRGSLAAEEARAPDTRAADGPYVAGEVSTAPVRLDGRVLFEVRGASSFPAEQRAAAIAERVLALARDSAFRPEALRVVEEGEFAAIYGGPTRVMVLVTADARLEQLSMKELASVHRNRIHEAITAWRAAREPRALLIHSLLALGVGVLVFLGIVLVLRLGRRIEAAVERRVSSRIKSVGIQSFEIVRAHHLREMIRGLLRVIRFAVVLALLLLYLPYALGLFPWTAPLAQRTVDLAVGPLIGLAQGFAAQIPNLVFLAILYVVVRFGVRLLRMFFEAIERGSVSFSGFESEWAMPTYKIARFVAVAFALVVAYPYIPGSQSEAFKGISLFLGLLVSLGATSMISQAIAGYSMIYRRAFRVGDRVRIGAVTGDVVESRLMVTHLRTVKNEMVVIPNSTVMGGEVVNFSALARDQGLILHATVGIGYETPWRQVEAMLLLAASRTPGLRSEPPPFVNQTALGDFCVTYELNVYCEDASAMVRLYTELHRRILDVFNEYGVQIMTPAYRADTPQPKVVPKDQWYLAPASPAPDEPAAS